MKRVIFAILVCMLPIGVLHVQSQFNENEKGQVSEDLKYAMSFVISGGKSTDVPENMIFDGCKVSVVEKVQHFDLTLTVDFNVVNWSSAASRIERGSQVFYVSGRNGFVKFDYAPEARSYFTLLGLDLRDSDKWRRPLEVAEERFRRAIQDVRKECPGIDSRY